MKKSIFLILILFDKNLYYSNDKNSSFNKYNILHLDYDNYPKQKNVGGYKKSFWCKI